jgi:ubiquinone/menaquinone biosynthesis C-methylase UbiE
LLSEVLGPNTEALIAEAGVREGASCLDLGCGGGDVSLLLARTVGATGRVLGVDADDEVLELARCEAEERGIANVEFEQHDVTEWEPDELFDVAYARFLLAHLTNPGAMIDAMRRHLRPGGTLIVEDIQYQGHFVEPSCPAFWRYVDLYTLATQHRGGDPDIGPRLPRLMREAGLKDIEVKVVQPAALAGGLKLLICNTLENIADSVIDAGLCTREELQETIRELYAFAHDPTTLMGGPRVFQLWGRA